MSVSSTAVEVLDDRDAEPRTPMKRLGSTRKLAAFNNIKAQLSEQTRVLEARAEAAAGVATELHDYCKRRADLELDYSRSLDKLARYATQRHRDQRHKRTEWQLVGAYSCWQTALEQTRALARDHAALGELYGGRLAARTQRAAEDVARMHRKCKDIVLERHEEVGNALAEAGAAGKARAAAATEWRAAAVKLRHAYEQRERVAAAEPTRQKKLKATDKELEKRRQRHSEARARALRARADYVLCLEAANATLQRYYLDDIAEIMLCMEVGFESVISRVSKCAAEADSSRGAALTAAARTLLACASGLDAQADRQRVMDAHAQAFTPPRATGYQGTPPLQEDAELASTLGDAAPPEDENTSAVDSELAARLAQLEEAAIALRAECRERSKTVQAAEEQLILQMEGDESTWDVTGMFGGSGTAEDAPPATPATPAADTPRREQEDYYLAKFRSYVCAAGRLARLEGRARTLRERLVPPAQLPPAPARTPGNACNSRLYASQPMVSRGQFASPLDEHLAATRRPLPLVLTACVRVIATYGLRHQGIFRVSGSQVEMQSLRAAFDRGLDPLSNVRDASDINSVAGLLKLYLRELRPPLLPPSHLDRLTRLAAVPDDEQFKQRMRELVAALPTSSALVLRYLFAHLAHIAEYSDENMMDAWNLAICLGPTLLWARGDGGGQVAAQNQVNELVKRLIVHHEEIFPQNVALHAAYRREDFNTEDNPCPDAEGDISVEAEASCSGSEQNGDEPDGVDDLSLYDDEEEEEEDDDDDDISDDTEAGQWNGDRDSATNERPPSPERLLPAAAQVAPAPDAAAPAADSGSGPSRRLAECTPDLVLDLPARDPADTFLHNRDTLKKRPRANQSSSGESGAEEPPPAEEEEAPKPEEAAAPAAAAATGAESPVPARNTARVAAKFADLTLTGGSLKPALAAKPALLRRPTPHPQHASPASTPPRVPKRDDSA
ncbi:rho GTPase-activating protein 4 isoform X3 [Plutella xylostella]|uniref:rho GTPase-activating protein 4 isoform X3 n=1 Tax=Plutella xylostella TaxID=51655 RepID=UPI002032920C|nr:rho GTPase-activating protein 4 isoform X3 [Plutella xylostella]